MCQAMFMIPGYDSNKKVKVPDFLELTFQLGETTDYKITKYNINIVMY